MKLIPPDKGTHAILGALVTLAVLCLAGPVWAALACLAVAVGREIYGWWRRGWRPFDRADWIEAAADIGSTLAGGAAVLAAFAIGINFKDCNGPST
jgi:hypothetical protein